VQRFSGNNFPVTFKRGLRSVEEKQRNAKQIEANEKERDGSGLAGDAGDCAETWLQSTNPRETTPPPTAYSSPSLLSLFSLFLPPPPPARSLWRHIKRVRFLFPAFSRHHHRYSSVTQGASGAAKNSSLDFFLFITTLAPILLIIRKDLRFCLLVYMI